MKPLKEPLCVFAVSRSKILIDNISASSDKDDNLLVSFFEAPDDVRRKAVVDCTLFLRKATYPKKDETVLRLWRSL